MINQVFTQLDKRMNVMIIIMIATVPLLTPSQILRSYFLQLKYHFSHHRIFSFFSKELYANESLSQISSKKLHLLL